MKRITIIGGGITGLTAAYYLNKKIQEQGLNYQLQLLEASKHLGGKIDTERREGYTIERGPDSFLIRKQSAERLAYDVGIGDKLVKNGTGKSYILVGDDLHPMPQGSFMGIPTQVRPFLSSSLFSMSGKLRAGIDFIKPKGEPAEDQSLGKFFRRRLGDEVVENLIEPLLSGIYAGDMDDLSLMATFPNFYHLEQKYGSLIKGLQKTMPAPSPVAAKKRSMFYSIEGGLQTLVEALAESLGDIVSTQTAVESISKMGNGYQIRLQDGTEFLSDSVLITTPYPVMKQMLRSYDFVTELDDIRATSVSNVALAFDQSAVKNDIDGTGFVVSRNSNYRITACTWTHKKWPETAAPEGKALLRCYLGRPGDQEIVDLSDEALEEIVLHDLNKIMKIEGNPLFSVVSRWKNAMPQYQIGHKQLIEKLERGLSDQLPGVFTAGSSYRGIGIPDCIDQGGNSC
ncbi:protoporphyrinogen IX oxidase [Gracilibacillus boraciitolerans JCM 21714]|uniref:Coproporphyrinogen III oxidase n=1 Tax=Gracilibacillus boraciitolerans JCM 21714 TaxID=1298598 RepID=W4VKH3_9BACI|nr:protoporphyrinogen oxidase [Gracilibacillus boraciitolerans]GAE93651.1 protoporphyrinogen IX oxidase [Gracilibacillus boraciitolerans JCM 21714]